MEKENILEIKDLCVNLMTVRGIIYAVQGVNMEVKKGEVHGVVGESGCGKSVSTKAIMKLHDEEKTEYEGQIMMQLDSGDADILQLNKKKLTEFRGKDVAMIFQDPMTSLNPIMKAGEQIAEVVRCKLKLNKVEAKEYVLDLFEKVGILPAEKRYNQYPFEMSGGMLQRIGIAMALASKPKLLIADEPTTALDVTIQAQILELMKKLQKESGTSLIFITHNLGVVAEICDSVSVMYAGRIVETASVLDIFDNPAHPYTKALLDSNPKESDEGKKMKTISGAPPLLYETFTACPFAPRCSMATDVCMKKLPEYTTIGEGHTVACHNWIKKEHEEVIGMGENLIEVKHMNKRFKLDNFKVAKSKVRYLHAVDNVSFSIEKGEIFGIIGESGSGKSTIGRCILRLLDIDSGSVKYAGKEISKLPQKELREYRKKMQMIFQNPLASFNPKMTIGQTLYEVGNVYKIPKAELDKKIADLVEYINLSEDALSRLPKELSGGQLQRLAIARALILEPEFLLADEPVSALDVSIQAQILNLLIQLKEEKGQTILFISHDLTVVRHVCDHIAVVYLGVIVEMGAVADVYNNMLHPYTQVLISARPKEHPLEQRERILLEGEIPNAIDVKEGCRFANRCPRFKEGLCDNRTPKLKDIGNGHFVACHYPMGVEE
ncbi:ABC transporter ATP-binding protein [Anaerosporobacter sp.]|uniref:ABC transporter ATP-binding protein n=1 Tax=Anaerosporobacter sp. TaxID=1872529 RepID=UPI00286F3FB2|nr:ABC transporter ATP-binding protein [Anaerosporobacter sp.]